jgi:hypothetical protein
MGGAYRGGPHTAILEFLECGRGGLGSLDELELALGAIDALGFGSHVGGRFCSSNVAETEARGSQAEGMGMEMCIRGRGKRERRTEQRRVVKCFRTGQAWAACRHSYWPITCFRCLGNPRFPYLSRA